MSYSIAAESDERDFATGLGYSEFAAWIDTLPDADISELKQLIDRGWSNSSRQTADQLNAALDSHPPELLDVADTAINLWAFLDSLDDEPIVISNGTEATADAAGEPSNA